MGLYISIGIIALVVIYIFITYNRLIKLKNANVRVFNNKIEMFPSNIIAKIFNYSTKFFFEADSSEKDNIKVRL